MSNQNEKIRIDIEEIKIERERLLSIIEKNRFLYLDSINSIILTELILLRYFGSDEIYLKPTSPLALSYHDIKSLMDQIVGVQFKTGRHLNLHYSDCLGTNLSESISQSMIFDKKKVFVLCGDGELQEGKAIEALCCIDRLNLKNITVIVDKNNRQKTMKGDFLLNFPRAFKNVSVFLSDNSNVLNIFDILSLEIGPKMLILEGHTQ